MKKLLFALALTSFIGGSAIASDGDKTAKKNAAKKECSTEAKASCSKTMAAGGAKPSCCASKNKTASLITPSIAEDKVVAKKTTL